MFKLFGGLKCCSNVAKITLLGGPRARGLQAQIVNSTKSRSWYLSTHSSIGPVGPQGGPWGPWTYCWLKFKFCFTDFSCICSWLLLLMCYFQNEEIIKAFLQKRDQNVKRESLLGGLPVKQIKNKDKCFVWICFFRFLSFMYFMYPLNKFNARI